jgi:hypothetical protein
MTSLLPRLAIGASCAVFVLSASAQAQAVPKRTAARSPQAAAGTPILQQSPNGLYRLSITDAGIELVGPAGGVKITAQGIEVRADSTVTLSGGKTIDLNGSNSIQLSAGDAGMLTLDGGGGSLTGPRVTLGCANGRPAARAGDAVDNSGSPVVAQGSRTVLICGN